MEILDLGIREYTETFDIQKDQLSKRIENKIDDTLILVEHFPVVTTGRLKGRESIVDEEYFRNNNILILQTNRGGSVTFHAPGQLVLYPVIDISNKGKNISSFLDFLEITVAASLGKLGVSAERIDGRRGVWVNGKKIAFTGIAFRKWVSYHGVSVNINNDIIPFSKIYPCGEADIRVTSVKECTGRDTAMSQVKKLFAYQFSLDLKEWAQV